MKRVAGGVIAAVGLVLIVLGFRACSEAKTLDERADRTWDEKRNIEMPTSNGATFEERSRAGDEWFARESQKGDEWFDTSVAAQDAESRAMWLFMIGGFLCAVGLAVALVRPMRRRAVAVDVTGERPVADGPTHGPRATPAAPGQCSTCGALNDRDASRCQYCDGPL